MTSLNEVNPAVFPNWKSESLAKTKCQGLYIWSEFTQGLSEQLDCRITSDSWNGVSWDTQECTKCRWDTANYPTSKEHIQLLRIFTWIKLIHCELTVLCSTLALWALKGYQRKKIKWKDYCRQQTSREMTNEISVRTQIMATSTTINHKGKQNLPLIKAQGKYSNNSIPRRMRNTHRNVVLISYTFCRLLLFQHMLS